MKSIFTGSLLIIAFCLLQVAIAVPVAELQDVTDGNLKRLVSKHTKSALGIGAEESGPNKREPLPFGTFYRNGPDEEDTDSA
ncbi:hypothetical protein SERLA73DRAFT_184270 [Serpula lacrymans var. lacrymans S7.3]|uniref:Uncharacterized protein n=2 Tax=Serpula lacrymans var. lacrymans TaxID=341189 RepID=F8Q2W3_SERL3|nr:uncharacterized protein SERLADRAFT_471873 [Serpula lacrymans var. lacrymans S7.9]EGN97524.1 hypothetical protein SERLA73DRAFT_184270 [Serpula lacrymans var. lacrymans S7.3]EGO23126.1 hypothetical protein SERLADRAFT_471873 [Serpula lacrymans var. lacrymans S7.9]